MNSKQLKQQINNLVFEGYLDKQSRVMKQWRKRWFVLTKNYLLSFRERKNYQDPTEVIYLNKIAKITTCDQQKHREFSIKIMLQDGTCFYLAGDCNSDRQKWIGVIGKQLIIMQSCKPLP